MKIALLQINPTVGDLAGNSRLIVEALETAAARGADLAVTPELALVGYLPRDLLLNPGFVARAGPRWPHWRAIRRACLPCWSGFPSPIPRTKGGRSSTASCCFAPVK